MNAYIEQQARKTSVILVSLCVLLGAFSSEAAAQRRTSPRAKAVVAQRHVANLPVGAVRLSIGNRLFYQHGMTFFIVAAGGYQVVAPPVGASIEVLPMGYEIVTTESEDLYYHEGVFYRYDPGRDVYQVVEGADGAEVNALPSAATEIRVSGALYYSFGSLTYRPVVRAGRTVYVIGRRR